ncbi:YbfB/YjiJ family MFS transporter [Rhizobium sp. SL42]|uniref:YbfB/YjiJ family MFS transporter n=1 Tax=Rhizobium sp. SL42 TaxID=2806346 RepID=UPI001F40A179|nr:YbfB/YjiJ family MFS transporter [Rhizobium sp. SL42]UJW74383.1 MFS transporter [Rhizobium sp. SL42]
MHDTSPKDVNLAKTAIAGALAMAAAMGFGRFVFTPILPGMISGLPLSSSDAGLIAAGNFVGYLVGAVLAAYGWATGRERKIGLGALAASSLLLVAMGVASDVAVFILIRFAAGVASAFSMIFISSIVLAHAAARGSETTQTVHFGGVGFGIALSSLVVFIASKLSQPGAAAWRIDWLYSAGVTLVLLAIAWWLFPQAPLRAGGPAAEPKLVWRRPLILLTLSYGLFGFGYVVTATFIVTMARMSNAGPFIEFLSWFVTGIAAAASLFLWRPVMVRIGLFAAYGAALLIQSFGVAATVALPVSAAPLVGGLLLGLTFMTVTAYGLRLGRVLAPESPRRALALMTAAFGIGQIIGPVVAGTLAERSGSFAAPTLVAAAVLAVSFLLVLPLVRHHAEK